MKPIIITAEERLKVVERNIRAAVKHRYKSKPTMTATYTIPKLHTDSGATWHEVVL